MQNYTAFDEDLRSMVVESIQSVMNFETIKKIQLEHKKHMKNKKGMGKKGTNHTWYRTKNLLLRSEEDGYWKAEIWKTEEVEIWTAKVGQGKIQATQIY